MLRTVTINIPCACVTLLSCDYIMWLIHTFVMWSDHVTASYFCQHTMCICDPLSCDLTQTFVMWSNHVTASYFCHVTFCVTSPFTSCVNIHCGILSFNSEILTRARTWYTHSIALHLHLIVSWDLYLIVSWYLYLIVLWDL